MSCIPGVRRPDDLSPGNKNTYIGIIYRHPSGNTENSLELIEKKVYAVMSISMPDIFLAGDFNTDLFKHTDSKCKALRSLYNQLGLTQLIKEATRVAENSQTLIDHISVLRPELYADIGISDHSLNICCSQKAKGTQ